VWKGEWGVWKEERMDVGFVRRGGLQGDRMRRALAEPVAPEHRSAVVELNRKRVGDGGTRHPHPGPLPEGEGD